MLDISGTPLNQAGNQIRVSRVIHAGKLNVGCDRQRRNGRHRPMAGQLPAIRVLSLTLIPPSVGSDSQPGLPTLSLSGIIQKACEIGDTLHCTRSKKRLIYRE